MSNYCLSKEILEEFNAPHDLISSFVNVYGDDEVDFTRSGVISVFASFAQWFFDSGYFYKYALVDYDFFESNLSGVEFRGLPLVGIVINKFYGENYQQEDSYSDGMKFVDCNLSYAAIDRGVNCVFRRSLIQGATFRVSNSLFDNCSGGFVLEEKARLINNTFLNSDLKGCNFGYGDFEGGSFSGCNLSNSVMRKTDFYGTDFKGAILDNVFFYKVNLKYAVNLDNAKISNCHFVFTSLPDGLEFLADSQGDAKQ